MSDITQGEAMDRGVCALEAIATALEGIERALTPRVATPQEVDAEIARLNEEIDR